MNCTWCGYTWMVLCAACLIQLAISQAILSGTMPSGIGNLANLELLALGENLLTGRIPDYIQKLSPAEIPCPPEQYLWNNSFPNWEHDFPHSILPSKEYARGAHTCFHREFHISQWNISVPELTSWPPARRNIWSSLSILDLPQNRFIGSIASQVGNLVNLRIFNLSENCMSGEMPSNLDCCLVLESLGLEGNKFNGTIPSFLISLERPTLTWSF